LLSTSHAQPLLINTLQYFGRRVNTPLGRFLPREGLSLSPEFLRILSIKPIVVCFLLVVSLKKYKSGVFEPIEAERARWPLVTAMSVLSILARQANVTLTVLAFVA
jgi:hypothetical protein